MIGRVESVNVAVVLERPAHGVTVSEVMAALTGDRELVARVCLAHDHLGARGRAWLERV